MIIRIMIMLLCMVIPANAATSSATAMKPGEFLVLCYHAVPLKPAPGDNYSISQKMFVEQMEYLRTHGYNPVSFKQILDAREGVKALPEKPVLLTFDDGYISYHDFVVPVLEELGYPSVLAVVGNFVGYPPKELPEPIMRWEQIRAVSKKKLVEVVSHSHDLHRAIQYTSQGNIAAAVNILAYDPVSNVYETEADYRSRLNLDFERQDEIFKKELGFSPDVMVWPYGAFNEVSLDIAKQHGIFSTFTLQAGYAHINRLDRLNRVLVENTKIQEFIRNVRNPQGEQYPVRAVQIDLDLIVNPDDPAETDVNLGKLIDRLVAMKVNTVILQAFADPDGDGDVDAVYFPNRVLPVRADIFGWAAHQIKIRDMAVYAWMPTMSIVLPDKAQNERLRVREFKGGESEPSSSWYGRLSPFSPRVADIMGTLYEDLASHAQVAGILFQDDAYLNDFEDFHPDAVARYDKQFGGAVKSLAGEESDIAKEWSRYKTQVIIDFTDVLKGRVQKYRPNALFARNLYAEVMGNPHSELWYAQNYEAFLNSYDYVVVMAYPGMEEAVNPLKWLKKLTEISGRLKDGRNKTVFKIQAYNWKKEVWIDDGELLRELRAILSSGGRHLAYYPDNVFENKPALDTIKLEMSTKTYPFLP